MRTPLILAAGAAGVVVAVLRRRRSQADADLWREATADASTAHTGTAAPH